MYNCLKLESMKFLKFAIMKYLKYQNISGGINRCNVCIFLDLGGSGVKKKSLY